MNSSKTNNETSIESSISQHSSMKEASERLLDIIKAYCQEEGIVSIENVFEEFSQKVLSIITGFCERGGILDKEYKLTEIINFLVELLKDLTRVEGQQETKEKNLRTLLNQNYINIRELGEKLQKYCEIKFLGESPDTIQEVIQEFLDILIIVEGNNIGTESLEKGIEKFKTETRPTAFFGDGIYNQDCELFHDSDYATLVQMVEIFLNRLELYMRNRVVHSKSWQTYSKVYQNTSWKGSYSDSQYKRKLSGVEVAFEKILQNAIEERMGKTFKNGLKDKQEDEPIQLEILLPTDNDIEKIESGEYEGVIRFRVTQHLTPRYLRNGDPGRYSAIFVIYIQEKTSKIKIHHRNGVLLPSSNRDYKVAILSATKIQPKTLVREASAENSRNAYRKMLMNVLRLERKSWQIK